VNIASFSGQLDVDVAYGARGGHVKPDATSEDMLPIECMCCAHCCPGPTAFYAPALIVLAFALMSCRHKA